MNVMWLGVDLTDGMFPNEKTVSLRTAGGQTISLFVSDSAVRSSNSGQGLLRVEVLQSDGGFSLVGLPSPSVEGVTVAKVARSALQG